MPHTVSRGKRQGSNWGPVFRVRGGCQCRALGWPGVQNAGESTGQGGWTGDRTSRFRCGRTGHWGRKRKRQKRAGKAPVRARRTSAKKAAPVKKAAAVKKATVARQEGGGPGEEGRRPRRRSPRSPPRNESRTALVRRARRINRELAEVFPYAHPELDFENPFQLLVATVLSAQTTDLRVNQTTPALFATYPTPEDLAAANPEEVEEILRPTGFFRAKTKSVIGLSKALRGQLRRRGARPARRPRHAARRRPQDRLRRPGQRLRACPGITVDTHFGRLVRRWQWTDADRPGQGRGGRRRALPEERVDDALAPRRSSTAAASATPASPPAAPAPSPRSARRTARARRTRRRRRSS